MKLVPRSAMSRSRRSRPHGRGGRRSVFDGGKAIIARVLLAAVVAVPCAAGSPRVRALAELTYSGDQQPLVDLDFDINAAGRDPAKLAPLERDLLAVLGRRDATFAGRQAAAHRLARVFAPGGSSGGPDALKPLETMLRNEPDSDLARLALEGVRGEAVDRIFVDALDETTGRVRLGMMDTVARRRTPAAVPHLTKLLRDSDPAVVAAAARALGEIADAASIAALHAFPEPSPAPIAAAKLSAASRVPTAAALGMLNELQRRARDPVHRAAAFRQSLDIEVGSSAARIAEALGGRDGMMKEVALESIHASRSPNLVSALLDKLDRWDAPTQRGVVAALGRRGEVAAADAIAKAAKHQDPEVRAAAIEALGFLPGTRAIATLLAGIAADPDAAENRIARQSLARLSGPEVAPAIIAGAAHGDPRLRIACLEQLALRNMTEAVPLLLRTRQDPDVSVRTAAVGALGDIASANEEAALLDWTIAAADETEQSRALRSLVSVTLRNPDKANRGRAVFASIENAPSELAVRLIPALGRIGGTRAAESVARLAIRNDPAVAEAALAALGRWNDASALPSLVKIAEQASLPKSRSAAVEGVLSHYEDRRVRWSEEDTTNVARLLPYAADTDQARNLIRLLHRADDRKSLQLAEKTKADPAMASAAEVAVDVIRANMAGPPKLSASTASGVANMMDGKTSTRWTTPLQGEEWIEIEFRRSRPFTRVTLDQTGRAGEFPESFEVFVSDEPQAAGGLPVATGNGSRTKTVIELPPDTRGRYLIIRNVAERESPAWAICELYVD